MTEICFVLWSVWEVGDSGLFCVVECVDVGDKNVFCVVDCVGSG